MQKTLLTLLFTLLFTGCIERGQTLKPAPVHVTPIKIKPTQALSKVKPIDIVKSKMVPNPTISVKIKDNVNSETATKNIVLPTQTPPAPSITVKDNSLFPLSDETKNKISGFFILVIGIIILL